jgi:hypothetical protein
MHARDARLLLVTDAVRPLMPGAILDNVSTTITAIKSGQLAVLPRLIVRPGREEPQRISQGTDTGPPNVHRKLPIEITVVAESRAQISEVLSAVEKAIPWTDATTGEALFELGDTAHSDDDAGNRIIYLATLTISTTYQTGLGQPDA